MSDQENIEYRIAVLFSTPQSILVAGIETEINSHIKDFSPPLTITTSPYHVQITTDGMKIRQLRSKVIGCLAPFVDSLRQTDTKITLRDELFREVSMTMIYLDKNDLEILNQVEASISIRLAHFNRRHHLHSSKKNKPIDCEIDSAISIESVVDSPRYDSRTRLYWRTETAEEIKAAHIRAKDSLPTENHTGNYYHQYRRTVRYTNQKLHQMVLDWTPSLKREIPLLPDSKPNGQCSMNFGVFLPYPSGNSFQTLLNPRLLKNLMHLNLKYLKFCIYFHDN